MNVLHASLSRSIQDGLLERLSLHYGVDLEEVRKKVPLICLGGTTTKRVYEVIHETKSYYVDNDNQLYTKTHTIPHIARESKSTKTIVATRLE